MPSLANYTRVWGRALLQFAARKLGCAQERARENVRVRGEVLDVPLVLFGGLLWVSPQGGASAGTGLGLDYTLGQRSILA